MLARKAICKVVWRPETGVHFYQQSCWDPCGDPLQAQPQM